MAKVLIVGGSGFLSGAIVRRALSEGHEVWTITRGRRPVPAGAHAITADRQDRPGFASAVAGASVRWDLVVDCIGFDAADARQDVELFTASRAGHLVFISTDSVIEPSGRPWSIDETYEQFTTLAYGWGKRQAEEVLLAATRQDPNRTRLTILRPGHIYGPGSLLGAIPRHWRDPELLERIQAQKPLALVGGGHFLHQPVFAADLWDMAESCADNPRSSGQIYFAPGPDTIETRDYYRFVAEALGTPLPPIEEVSISRHLLEHPQDLPACCHRVVSTHTARSHGLSMPRTPVREGIRAHVQFLRETSNSVEGKSGATGIAGATTFVCAAALAWATALTVVTGCGTSGNGSAGVSAPAGSSAGGAATGESATADGASTPNTAGGSSAATVGGSPPSSNGSGDGGPGSSENPDGSAGDGGIQPYKGVALTGGCQDLEALNLTWFYGWTASTGCKTPVQFVPMIWGHPDENISGEITAAVAAGYTSVLGFNEPDNTSQSNMPVARAISLWPDVTAAPSLRVGSPATSANSTGQAWFEQFMTDATQQNLRVDFVAIHWYGWNAGSCDNASTFESYITWAEQYNLPIWITEWGCLNDSDPDAGVVRTFYDDAIVMFQKHPLIERYAWHETTATDTNALIVDGGLTPLGTDYAAAPLYR